MARLFDERIVVVGDVRGFMPVNGFVGAKPLSPCALIECNAWSSFAAARKSVGDCVIGHLSWGPAVVVVGGGEEMPPLSDWCGLCKSCLFGDKAVYNS